MNSVEGYPSYKNKEEFKASEIYPSLTGFLLMYIGFLEISFGILVFITASQKSILSIPFILIVLLSLGGGISFMLVAKQPNAGLLGKIKKMGFLLKIGFVIGLLMGAFYFYIIIRALSQV